MKLCGASLNRVSFLTNITNVLKRVSKIGRFCLEKGRGLMGPAAPPHPRIYRRPPVKVATTSYKGDIEASFTLEYNFNKEGKSPESKVALRTVSGSTMCSSPSTECCFTGFAADPA